MLNIGSGQVIGIDVVGDVTTLMALANRPSAMRGFAVGGAAFDLAVVNPATGVKSTVSAIAVGADFVLYFELGVDQVGTFTVAPAAVVAWTD